jgi:hypothetical protein
MSGYVEAKVWRRSEAPDAYVRRRFVNEDFADGTRQVGYAGLRWVLLVSRQAPYKRSAVPDGSISVDAGVGRG